MSTRLLHAITIACAPAQAYDYACAPGHWPEWHPSSLRLFGAVDHALPAGATFEEDVRAGGRNGHLRWTVVEAQRPARWIATAEVDNGARLSLTYRFAPHGDGTAFERELAYELSSPWLRVLDALVLRRRIAAESALSLRQLKAALERWTQSRPESRSIESDDDSGP
jgi:hypothetical protein